ncbi:MAG: T9SS type A sorting domain-containing protein, partial [Bacteroidales bacterium]|nr:T9SS type A sorting domain-containing protein [Bacteroidales bacterium]
NAILNNSYSGIFISHSYSKIFNNTGIHDNYRGIVCTNYSNVEITGNSEATHTSQTQRIHDNSVNQIWASLHSFPYLKWNAIWDNDNTSSLVYWDLGDSEPSAEDISNNFWGPQEYFDPQEDFSPYLSFNWQPVWNLQYGPPPANPDELLYESAETKMDQGDYQGAKADYLELITNFPQSKLSQAALKELLPLEKLTSNNFPELQSYYLNAPEVINNPDLFEIGYWLSNWCNVELNNFQAAIQFYENVLSAPPSFQDSIFAIIDLCYINYLMQNFNSKSGYSFDRPVFVQSSDEEYDKTVHLHSGLIFRNTIRNDSPEKNQTLFKPGELLQNTPNPFRSTTLLRYRLDETCNVQAKIFNSSGQLIKTLNDGLKTKGAHCIELMGNDLPEGLYLYSIELDGNITDTKKMLIIR